MATTKTRKTSPPIDAAFEQAAEQSERALAAVRQAGNVYLDVYEKAVDRTIDLEVKMAGLTQQDWLKNLIRTQTDIARDVADTYTSTARTFLK
ncbi:MAG: hypothetical protein JOZ73_11500 [Solirubrobacterales bacterium]|nr:hypothetical protein [Solirubrobacterales bacterium]MBV9311453.1 hypothetical protein [Solirubrobacterales bacterium]